MQNILYLSYDGLSDPLGESQILAYLKGLKGERYQITLITFEKVGNYEKHRERLKQETREANIKWLPQKYHASPPVLSTLYDLWKLKRLIKSLQRDTPFDLVHCRSYLTALLGEWMQKRYSAKMIFDMRAFFADERAESGSWPPEHLIYGKIFRFFKKKEKDWLEKSEAIISLTEVGKQVMNNRSDIKRKHLPIKVIPCAADLSLFSASNIIEEETKQLQEKLMIPSDAFVLLYIGSVERYLPHEMLRFFKEVQKVKPNSVFLFLTGTAPKILFDLAKRKGVNHENLRVQRVDRLDMPKYIALADLSLFFAKPGLGKTIYSPVKQGELMAMGIPMVCNRGLGEADKILEKYDAGFVIEDFTQAEYSKIAQSLDSLEKFDREKIIQGAQEVYSLQQGINRYKQVYESIL